MRSYFEEVFNTTPEQAAADLCDNYCKYPCIWDEEKDGPLEESEVCKDCPVNILVRMVYDAN